MKDDRKELYFSLFQVLCAKLAHLNFLLGFTALNPKGQFMEKLLAPFGKALAGRRHQELVESAQSASHLSDTRPLIGTLVYSLEDCWVTN
jgi:hypothetical protein